MIIYVEVTRIPTPTPVENTEPDVPSGLKAAAGKKKVTLTWKKMSDIAGYQIRYSLKKNMKSAKTVNVNKTKTKQVIKKLTSKKTYYFQIRSYKFVKGKMYYSKWSGKKSVKVK